MRINESAYTSDVRSEKIKQACDNSDFILRLQYQFRLLHGFIIFRLVFVVVAAAAAHGIHHLRISFDLRLDPDKKSRVDNLPSSIAATNS